MTISLRLNEEDSQLIKSYAAMKKMSVSDVMRNAVIEAIEDEYDLQAYHKAMEEYKKNPMTYSHDEVRRMLEIDR
jgi:RHH-type rel operon transcriptional repressor/antitoxin RelB